MIVEKYSLNFGQSPPKNILQITQLSMTTVSNKYICIYAVSTYTEYKMRVEYLVSLQGGTSLYFLILSTNYQCKVVKRDKQ